MFIVGRVLYRARILSEQWMHNNAFLLGLVFGSVVTTVVLLIH